MNLETAWLACQLTKDHLPVQQGDDGAPRHLLDSWPWSIGLDLHGPIYMQLWWGVFSINTVGPANISAGFVSKRVASADSTNRGWKTVFSHLQMQLPNRRFPAADFHPGLRDSTDAKGQMQRQKLLTCQPSQVVPVLLDGGHSSGLARVESWPVSSESLLSEIVFFKRWSPHHP